MRSPRARPSPIPRKDRTDSWDISSTRRSVDDTPTSRCRPSAYGVETAGYSVRRRRQPARVRQPPFGVDDHRLVAREALDQLEPGRRAENEDAGRQSVSRRRVRTDYRHADDAFGRLAGTRIQDMVVAAAVVLEVPLVIARRRYRLVDERQPRDDLAVDARMADADDPRPAAAVTEHARIAARVQHRVPDAALTEQRRG